MHDFFDIVGLSRSAPPVEVRRACARLIRRSHPDFRHPAALDAPLAGESGHLPRCDAAVDFVHMSTLVDRIQSTFFRFDPPRIA